MTDRSTIANRIIAFYLSGERPLIDMDGIAVMDPFQTKAVQSAVAAFYARFFNDNAPRVAVLGINPGRFGGGVTGIPFTDPWALVNPCGIETGITGKRELSSEFIYAMIELYGGASAFYRRFLISAVLPFGLVRAGKNLNYYDERALVKELTPYIVRTMRTQLEFGVRRDVAVVLGGGKNLDYMSRINTEHQFFDRLVPLDHPRFIMQYRRKRLDEYLERYVETLKSVASM